MTHHPHDIPSDEKPAAAPAGSEPSPENTPEKKKPHRHLIRPKWLRVPLKVLFWIVAAVLVLPWLLYIPPVQNWVKNIACDAVYKSTGMKIGIDRFHLGFPVDVNLEGVSVLYAGGDTMVRAAKAVLDVKPLPLLRLDVQIKRLQLFDGYYKMVSPDSSMVLKINAGYLDVDDKSSADIATSEINLNKAVLRRGSVDLYMDVWKKKSTPADTTSTPFVIRANDLELDHFRFGMSMLPTIDTLDFKTDRLSLKKGLIDLRKSEITMERVTASDGNVRYIAPSAQYVASHPAPAPIEESAPSEPITIKGAEISLDGFTAFYGTKGAPAAEGFDPAAISFTGLGITLENFYNREATVKLPVTRLEGREKCGVEITRGSGTVGVSADGLELADIKVATVYSLLNASGQIPFAVMSMEDTAAPMRLAAAVSLGMPDIEDAVPAVKPYTSKLPAREPLKLTLDAEGSLDNLDISTLDVALGQILSLKAEGTAGQLLNPKALTASLDFDGTLSQPKAISGLLGKMPYNIPRFNLKGHAGAKADNYSADFQLLTEAGDVVGSGEVGLSSERYDADVQIKDFNVAYIDPSLGIGHVTARIGASGAGFNPENPSSHTDVQLQLWSAVYNGHLIRDVRAHIGLDEGHATLVAESPNETLNFRLDGQAWIEPDLYDIDFTADLNNVDLQALGLSPTANAGHGIITVSGQASPARWLYDMKLNVRNLYWSLPDGSISLPEGLSADFIATSDDTRLTIVSNKTDLDFESSSPLKRLIDGFTQGMDVAVAQIDARSLQIDKIRDRLPEFNLSVRAGRRGLLHQVLASSGVTVDSVAVNLANDSLLSGHVFVDGINTGSMAIDTLTLGLSQRGSLIDYILHMGNSAGTLDEFANVDVRGYLGENRLSAFAVQQNLQGQTGYRVGLTAAFQKDLVSLHFTPVKATIAYLPWQFNMDNYIDYYFNGRVEADVQARSKESSLMVRTEDLSGGGNELHVKIDNLHIQDFLQMSLTAPPVTADVNADIRVRYDGKELSGDGTLGLAGVTYEGISVGNFDLGLQAGMMADNTSHADITMKIDGEPAMAAYASLRPGEDGIDLEKLGLRLTRFPLKVANAFLGPETASLGGWLNGDMLVTGKFSAPLLNGSLACDSVTMYMPMMGTTFKFDDTPLTVADNVIKFDNFDIYAVNANPLQLDGEVNASHISDIYFDLRANASNLQLVGTGKKAKSALAGKLFLNLTASAKGRMSMLDVHANANILPTTDVTYTVETIDGQISTSGTDDVVKFVNFNDSTQMADADSITSALNMRINASLTMSQGMKAAVNISGAKSNNRVELHPSGTLTYSQNFLGDMRLNGQLNVGEGFVRYSMPPVLSEKVFAFDPQSYVVWNGAVLNPVLHIKATDTMRVNVTSNGSSRLVTFLVSVSATNNLEAPNVVFNVSTNDDMTVQNELESMTADQRATQAMNLLLYGNYTGPNVKTAGQNVTENMLYGLLEGQLNNLAAKYVKGVDLSFGVDQYDNTTNGNTQSATTYSYQVSKSLFNNRFKIMVGGNYSTDADADENLSDNLVSDVTLEYILKQTNTTTLSGRIFRHTGFESILEGEITEMGVGFSLQRKLQNLRNLFRLNRKRRNDARREEKTDTVKSTENVESK